jgi:hypothetical protein
MKMQINSSYFTSGKILHLFARRCKIALGVGPNMPQIGVFCILIIIYGALNGTTHAAPMRPTNANITT